MKLRKISEEEGENGVNVSLFTEFEDITKASDEEYEKLIKETKKNLGSSSVIYLTGKHEKGVVLEFLSCQTPENWQDL